MVSVLSAKAAAAVKPAGQPISTVSGDSSNSSTCETPTPVKLLQSPPVQQQQLQSQLPKPAAAARTRIGYLS
eukprot:1151141-Pelagomonas_calceolata.AAC.2